jgi:hypothetical protein
MPNFISEGQIEMALVQQLQHLHAFATLIGWFESFLAGRPPFPGEKGPDKFE